jgi:hypothetical protein
VVFAEAEEGKSQLIGKDAFLDDLAKDLRLRERLTLTVVRDITERIKT